MQKVLQKFNHDLKPPRTRGKKNCRHLSLLSWGDHPRIPVSLYLLPIPPVTRWWFQICCFHSKNREPEIRSIPAILGAVNFFG